MKKQISKIPLDFSLYEEYEISQEYVAYTIEFLSINDKECEDLEYEYTSTGYKIFFSEIIRAPLGRFNLRMIIAKCEVIF